MFIEKATSFDQKKLFLFFTIFLFFLKTKNSNFDNQQLKIINESQTNNNSILKINETQNSLKSYYNYF
jgi:hypothetical protein